MILSFWDSVSKFFNDIWNYINKNYDNYFFWIIIFVIILALGLFTISKFANK